MGKAVVPGAFDVELTQGNVKNAMKAAEAKGRDLYMVPIGNLKTFDGFNIRITETKKYQEGIQDLANSMKSEGFYPDKPLAGYIDGNDICITDGHRRLAGAVLANTQGASIEALPVVVKPAGTSREDLTVALVQSNTGAPLTPYETGIAVKRLLGYGMEKAVVATRLGLSERYIDDLMLLQGAPKSVRDMVIADKVTATTAIATLKNDAKGAADALKTGLEKAEKSGKKRVTAKNLPAKKKKGNKKKGSPEASGTADPGSNAAAGDAEPRIRLLPEAESRLSGVLDALEVIEAYQPKMPDMIDELMRDLLKVSDSDKVIALAIKVERYEATGLVRLGLIDFEEPAAPASDTAGL